MSKFVFVKEKPATLKKGEHFIPAPNFFPEIEENKAKAGNKGVTGPNHLRSITGTIARIYDPEDMTPYSVKVHLFEGRPYKNDEELNAIVCEMLLNGYPKIFNKWVEYQIKNRPAETKLIYFQDTGLHRIDSVFFKFGLSYDHETEESAKPKKASKKEDKNEDV